MSVDGPGILESDLGHDVYSQIIDLYDAGVSVAQMRQRITRLELTVVDDLELEIYLAASSKALWEIGHLDPARSTKLSLLLERGSSLALWTKTGNDQLAKARKVALTRLLAQIATPRIHPRGRKKYTAVQKKLFSEGDCLHLVAGAKTYRSVVCKILEHRRRCEYAMLVLAPSKSIASAKYYGRKIPSSLHDFGFVLGPHVIRPEHRMLVREGNPFEVVGHVELDPTKFMLGSFGGVLHMDDLLADFERTTRDSALFGNQLLPLRGVLRARPRAEA